MRKGMFSDLFTIYSSFLFHFEENPSKSAFLDHVFLDIILPFQFFFNSIVMVVTPVFWIIFNLFCSLDHFTPICFYLDRFLRLLLVKSLFQDQFFGSNLRLMLVRPIPPFFLGTWDCQHCRVIVRKIFTALVQLFRRGPCANFSPLEISRWVRVRC